jgi:DNA-binding TFAR19-related protein (PDSD5 family)
MYEHELEELKKKKQEELKKQQELNQQFLQLETIAKQYLTREAIERYSNIKMGHPELAIKVVALIAQAVQMNQLREKLDDNQFKKLLVQIQPEKEKFRFIK